MDGGKTNLDLSRKFLKKYYHHILLSSLVDNTILGITNVYGPHTKIERRTLWEECTDFKNLVPNQWIGGANFNFTRFLWERSPREGDFSNMEESNNFVLRNNLIEIPLNNRSFT